MNTTDSNRLMCGVCTRLSLIDFEALTRIASRRGTSISRLVRSIIRKELSDVR